jgi:hypothetical protein
MLPALKRSKDDAEDHALQREAAPRQMGSEERKQTAPDDRAFKLPIRYWRLSHAPSCRSTSRSRLPNPKILIDLGARERISYV